MLLSFREELELREHQNFSEFAAFSDQSLGRDREEPPCDMRTIYQRDRDRILHSKSFRRLKGKTQVFLAPEGDHYRTRLTHTLEVAQTARSIAKALLLNEDLTEAIALGHDLGHTPFGHAGERALNEVCAGGFKHQMQSIRVVELLEKDGKGLNLTKEVRDGILNHSTAGNPHTLEGKIVRICDKIAYVNSDIDDAIRGKIISDEDLPTNCIKILGKTLRERLNTLLHDIVVNSRGLNDIVMSDEIRDALVELRKFMFENVYVASEAKKEEGKAGYMLKALYEYYLQNPDKLPEFYRNMYERDGEELSRVICDYIAGMTDHYAVLTYKDLMIPRAWQIL
ncbi:MAG: deoxyguanosinetriphosphate triphosphohydrolase [Eubacterium sp.]|nr:deoxyguanosinetriphosphate triphosphohydrolase [Eubacterium sp.]